MTWADLVEDLAAAGHITPRWRPVFHANPRAAFLPPRALTRRDGDGTLTLIDRLSDPAGWDAAVNSDTVVITQMDDGQVPAGQRGDSPTSSCSMPSIVAEMLDHLDVRDGHRVLEIGTGTGWNAALLCHRLGDQQVTTVEIDPDVAEQARKALADQGLHPQLVVGDGELGHPPAAPYDRIVSTCSVTTVPYAWVEQTRPGGRIVTPWRGPFARNGHLLVLDAAADGSASGRFAGWASFMTSRRQRMPTDEVAAETGAESTTGLHPDRVLDGDHAETAVGLSTGTGQWWRLDLDSGGWVINVDDVATGSWAQVGPLTDDAGAPYPVRQGGPRRLWDEAEAAYRWWQDAGRPGYDRFGLTVTPGEQWIWLDHPDQRIDPPAT